MTSYHHRPIKRFALDGMIHDEATIGRLKIEYIRLLTTEMRISGYVPRLDIDPDFTISFNQQSEYFEFKLTVHGVYAGKNKSKWIIGVDGTTAIYIQKSRLSEFSQEQV